MYKLQYIFFNLFAGLFNGYLLYKELSTHILYLTCEDMGEIWDV